MVQREDVLSVTVFLMTVHSCDLAALISAVCGTKSILEVTQDTGCKGFTTNSICCPDAIFSLVSVTLLPKGAIQQLYLTK